MSRYAAIAFTPAVKEFQQRYNSRASYAKYDEDAAPPNLGEEERLFIESRDSLFMATVTETGWPYVQHRGAPPGFLRVLDSRTIAFADFRGNKQYISAGNISRDDRVALFLIDYPNRERLKLFVRARIVNGESDPESIAAVAVAGYPAHVERAIVMSVEGFSWNCSQHITPRYTLEEFAALSEGEAV
jgi:predicted pyridoxine 5'-phosphate oxidase superfamily flavin-nucleotide-binding protein